MVEGSRDLSTSQVLQLPVTCPCRRGAQRLVVLQCCLGRGTVGGLINYTPILWSHIPSAATVSHTSTILQIHVGNCEEETETTVLPRRQILETHAARLGALLQGSDVSSPGPGHASAVF